MAKPELKLSAVRRFLSDALGAEACELRELASGEWSQAFEFVAAGAPLIARFASRPDDFLLDRFAAGFAGPELPIPRIRTIGRGLGGHYAISERLFGEFFEGGSEAQMRRKLPAFLVMLDALRQIDTSSSRGFGAWQNDGPGRYSSWRDVLLDVGADRPGDRIAGWRAKLAQVDGAEQRFQQALSQLQKLASGCPELRHVIHSDLTHRNVLVEQDRISAVFDWGCAMYGDFLYDLAWLCFWSPWHPELRHIDLYALARSHYAEIGLEVPDFELRMGCCELHIGLTAQAYNAFTDRWDELVLSGERTLECAAAAQRSTQRSTSSKLL